MTLTVTSYKTFLNCTCFRKMICLWMLHYIYVQLPKQVQSTIKWYIFCHKVIIETHIWSKTKREIFSWTIELVFIEWICGSSFVVISFKGYLIKKVYNAFFPFYSYYSDSKYIWPEIVHLPVLFLLRMMTQPIYTQNIP